MRVKLTFHLGGNKFDKVEDVIHSGESLQDYIARVARNTFFLDVANGAAYRMSTLVKVERIG